MSSQQAQSPHHDEESQISTDSISDSTTRRHRWGSFKFKNQPSEESKGKCCQCRSIIAILLFLAIAATISSVAYVTNNKSPEDVAQVHVRLKFSIENW